MNKHLHVSVTRHLDLLPPTHTYTRRESHASITLEGIIMILYRPTFISKSLTPTLIVTSMCHYYRDWLLVPMWRTHPHTMI